MKSESAPMISLMTAIALLSLVMCSIPSFAAVAIISPAAGSTYNSFHLSYSITETPLSGSVSLVFTSTGATRTIALNDASSADFLINPTLNLLANYGAHINSVTGGATIPDGVYSVSLSYQSLMGGAAISTTNNAVTIDTLTGAPTLTLPAASATYTTTLPVQFSTPESALSGSKKLTLSSASDTIVLTLKDAALTEFNLNLSADPGTNDNVLNSTASSIPDGLYTVTFEYQDALGNAAASSSHASVRISQEPTSSTPAADPNGSVSSGGGCLSVKSTRDQSPGAVFEPFLWMMLCGFSVWLLRGRRMPNPSP